MGITFLDSLKTCVHYSLFGLQREGKGSGNSKNDRFSTTLRGYCRALTDKEVLQRVDSYTNSCYLNNRVLIFPSDLPKSSVSEFIVNKIPISEICRHPIEDYVEAFRAFHYKPKEYLGAGGEQVAIELENGNVLKIQAREPGEYFGKRPFDLPVLENGKSSIISPVTGKARDIHWLIQPKAEMTATEDDVNEFKAEIDSLGYKYAESDFNRSQVGFYNGKLYLIDYYLVEGYPRKLK